MATKIEERATTALSGWLALPLFLAAAAWVGWSALGPVIMERGEPSVVSILLIPLVVLLIKGFVILEPNQAAVMIFFGRYAGTLRTDGFFWVNPFYSKHRLSLRAHNLNTPTLKVNDRAGNPIEVAAVIVWRVADTARASFDVENYQEYVRMQSESAVRQVVSDRWYDGDDQGKESLRGDLDTVARQLVESIHSHCDFAGLEILEARISHLAYAPEIAGAMLRRQQAVAVVAARVQMVAGAVGMVKLAIEQLEQEQVVTLAPEERIRLVTNLMTVLVGDEHARPMLSVDSH